MESTERRAAAVGGEFRFRVSDAFHVPLRGYMLRLRLVEGAPKVSELRRGRRLRLRAPDGSERMVRVRAVSATFGRASDARLEAKRQIDVVIPEPDAWGEDGRVVEIGWEVVGPA